MFSFQWNSKIRATPRHLLDGRGVVILTTPFKMADNNEAEESIEGGDLIDLEWSDGDFCLFSCLHVKGENSTTLEEW